MFERFSADAREAVVRAQGSARRLHHEYIGTEHLLLGLLEQDDTLAGRVLAGHGLDRLGTEAAVVRILGATRGGAGLREPGRARNGREAGGGEAGGPDAGGLDADAGDANALDADALDADALDADALEAIGIDVTAVRDRVEAAFGAGALDREPGRRRGRVATRGAVPFTRRARKALELSLRESLRLRHPYIGDGHLLLGLLAEGEGLAVRVLTEAGTDLQALRAELDRMIPARPAR